VCLHGAISLRSLRASLQRLAESKKGCGICKVGQNRIYTPYMTVYLVIFRLKTKYICRIYMVLAKFRGLSTKVECVYSVSSACNWSQMALLVVKSVDVSACFWVGALP